MSKTLKTLVLTLAVSASAIGCATNSRTAGDPIRVTPAGGSGIASGTTTYGTAGAVPMISAAVDPSVDAIAVLEANRGFEGRILGPAAPGTPAASSQQGATGQFVSPASNLLPAGAFVGSAVGGSPVTGFSSGATVNPANAVGTNFGVTGLSHATATGIAATTTPGTNMTASAIAGGAGMPLQGTGVSPVLSAPSAGTNTRLSGGASAAARTLPAVRLETAPNGGTVVTNSRP